MTGTLGLFSLVDLFQLIAASARTGRLGVFHPEGNARIYFQEGQVVHAEFNDIEGEAAVYTLFEDERGSFDFQMGIPASKRSVQTSTENLLLEIIRRLDEAKRDGDTVAEVSAEAIPTFAETAADTTKLTFESYELDVVKLIDGRLEIQEIAARLGLNLSDTKRVVNRLVKLGMVKLRSRRPRTARLVVQLTHEPLPRGTVAVESNIYANWTRNLGFEPEKVACRRANGHVDIFAVKPLEGVGPYLLLSRETLFGSDISVNITLLVKPVIPSKSIAPDLA